MTSVQLNRSHSLRGRGTEVSLTDLNLLWPVLLQLCLSHWSAWLTLSFVRKCFSLFEIPVLLTDSQDTYLQANYWSHPCHGWMSGFRNLWFCPTRVRVNGSSEEPGCRSSQVDNSCSSLLCHISLSCRQGSRAGPSLSSPRFSLMFKLNSQAPPHLPRSHFWERAPASYTNLYPALLL